MSPFVRVLTSWLGADRWRGGRGTVRGVSVLRVASWNLFHGRAVPPVRRDLLGDYAAALAGADWDLCGLQEVPPWWARPLAEAAGASGSVVRTSLLRGTLPAAQRAFGASDPERLGVRGAAVNVLLVRPTAGRIVGQRSAALRRAPQRRTVHAVRIARPAGGAFWAANVHAHNRPADAAERDVVAALTHVRAWAGDEPAILVGDLNLDTTAARLVAARERLVWLAGQRVDHVLGTPGTSSPGQSVAFRPRTLDRSAVLSDHRLVVAPVQLPG